MEVRPLRRSDLSARDRGKSVLCVSEESEHWIDRTLCLSGTRKPECPTCPHSRFVVRFRLRVFDQVVACPRWESEEDRKNRKDPLDYVPIQRDICVNEKPFLQCDGCPNGDLSEAPRDGHGWFQEQERKRRIDLELDEEERG